MKLAAIALALALSAVAVPVPATQTIAAAPNPCEAACVDTQLGLGGKTGQVPTVGLVCSTQARHRMRACAECIDSHWTHNSNEESAMSEYGRYIGACDMALLNE